MPRTKKQNENLLKLANYLKALPEDYEHFDMKAFIEVGAENYMFPRSLHKSDIINSCGTVACAVGHGPSAGIIPKRKEFWVEYSNRAFTNNEDEWDWCFNSEWFEVDNTLVGAYKRIYLLLDIGVPNFDIEERVMQYEGEGELSEKILRRDDKKLYKSLLKGY